MIVYSSVLYVVYGKMRNRVNIIQKRSKLVKSVKVFHPVLANGGARGVYAVRPRFDLCQHDVISTVSGRRGGRVPLLYTHI